MIYNTKEVLNDHQNMLNVKQLDDLLVTIVQAVAYTKNNKQRYVALYLTTLSF